MVPAVVAVDMAVALVDTAMVAVDTAVALVGILEVDILAVVEDIACKAQVALVTDILDWMDMGR